MSRAVSLCPCGRSDSRGRPLALAACCGPRLAGDAAPDAEALMRSRYTAYVLGDEAYLRATWLPDTCPPDLQLDPATRWLGLEVRAHRQIDADHAEVEFVARYRVQGRGARLHERSRFVRDAQGRWLYVDGEIR
ncbi:YchJ family protein [Ramlibacter sp.]